MKNLPIAAAKRICLRLRDFVLRHKIASACTVVGIFGGIVGVVACSAAGIFAELIFRRIQDEKSEVTFDSQVAAHKTTLSQTKLAQAYADLELLPGATLAQVKSAHRRLAAQYHPDSAGGNQERFLQIQQAYELILDEGEWGGR